MKLRIASIIVAFAAVASSIPELADDLYLEFSRTGNRAGYEKPYFERVKQLERLRDAEKTTRDAARWQNLMPAFRRAGVEWAFVKPLSFPSSLADLESSMRFIRSRIPA